MIRAELGEVAEFINGAAFKPTDWGEDGRRIIRIQNLNDPAKPYNRTFKNVAEKYLVQPGTLLVSWSASLGVFEWNETDTALLNQHIFKVVPNERKIDQAYLRHMLENALVDMSRHHRGSTMVHVNRKEFLGTTIPLPPLEEQKWIAGILDQADTLRRLRTRALEKLNTLGQAIFHEMFGNPLRDQLESIGWQREPLEDCIGFIDYRGKTPPKAPNGIRLVTAKNVKMGYINPEPKEFIDASAFDDWMSRGFPQKGDVLFTTEAPLGNVAILDSDETLAIGQRLLTLQPDDGKLLSAYVAFFLRTPGFHKEMMRNSSGSTAVGIKSKLLKKIEIAYPSLSAQRAFESSLNDLEKLKLKYQLAELKTQETFASLQHRAFRGEL